jgi:hypothetical protein
VDGEHGLIKHPLHLGPLRADGHSIYRSGLRWLIQPGQYCRANQIFAYCNVNLWAASSRLTGPRPFAEETDLQVAFAPRAAGRIYGAGAELGGYLSIREVCAWDAEAVIAYLEAEAEPDPDVERLRLLMLAGRRMTGLADVHSGLLPGWHGRTRGWWCDEDTMPVSLLSLGICDATGVVIGEQCAFAEMFEAARAPGQMIFVPDHPLAPVAPVLLDQLDRKPAQFQAIADDMHRFLSDSKLTPTAEDWMFSGAMLSVLQRSPIEDTYSLLTPSGTARTAPADAVLLSLSSEPQSLLRHKSLGYHVHIMRHHQAAAGPVFRAFLKSAFETLKRSVDDIRSDYERLLDRMDAATGARALVINRMSTSGHEDISNYSSFDPPMSSTLSSVAAKELNLMLHDIAERRDLIIIDVDAIAADLGGAEHLPDGIHQSGPMQAALRLEILRALEDLGPQPQIK